MTQIDEPRAKRLHAINERHANFITFATVGFGLVFLDFLAFLSGGFFLAGVFAVVVIIFLTIRAVIVGARKPSQPTNDDQS